jgi:hypothetical protein
VLARIGGVALIQSRKAGIRTCKLDNIIHSASVWMNAIGIRVQQQPIPDVFAQMIAGGGQQRTARSLQDAMSKRAA